MKGKTMSITPTELVPNPYYRPKPSSEFYSQTGVLLEEKLLDIARALGKIDEHGQVAEDLRAQVLGQLGSALRYDRLYQEAVTDPTLKRTRQELEVAMSNAYLARQVVFELFQELERFNLGDYQKFDDQGRGIRRLVDFVSRSARYLGWSFSRAESGHWKLIRNGEPEVPFTTDRETAIQSDQLQLLGLEHPFVVQLLQACTTSDHIPRAIFGFLNNLPGPGLLTIWKINTQNRDGLANQHIVRIGINEDGDRAPWLEQLDEQLLGLHPPCSPSPSHWQKMAISMKQRIQELLHRELTYSGIVSEDTSYSAIPLAIAGLERESGINTS